MEYSSPTNTLLISILLSTDLFENYEKFQGDLHRFDEEMRRMTEHIKRLRDSGAFLQIISLRNKLQKFREFHGERIAVMLGYQRQIETESVFSWKFEQEKKIEVKFKNKFRVLEGKLKNQIKSLSTRYKSLLYQKRKNMEEQMIIKARKNRGRILQIKAMKAINEYFIGTSNIDTAPLEKKIRGFENIENEKIRNQCRRVIKHKLDEWITKYKKEKKRYKLKFKKKLKKLKKEKEKLLGLVRNEGEVEKMKISQRIRNDINIAQEKVGKGLVSVHYEKMKKGGFSDLFERKKIKDNCNLDIVSTRK